MLKNLRLKWKIIFYFLLFSTILLFVLWFFQVVLLEDMYMKKRTDEVEQAIIEIRESIEKGNIEETLITLEREKNIFVTLTKEFVPNIPMDRRDKEDKRTIMLTKEESFELENGEIISLTFNAMLTPVDSTVETLQEQLYIITIIMVFFSLIISILISKKIAKPIEKINNSAKFLSTGKYDVTFNGEGFLEISELSDTLNIAAKELSKIDDLRKELIANISHDLRTPLSLIYSYAEIMNDFPDEITSEQTQVIMEETKRLTTLVNDLLTLSKFESNVMEINKTRFNITKEINKTIIRTNSLIAKSEYDIKFEFDEEVHIEADKVKIMQVFYNLLINAINYTGNDNKVTVRQKVNDNKIKIEVIDTGDGIDNDMLPYIWERYFKVDKVHKRGVTGTGLGLSIVKNIMELHNGNYGVETKKNEGSTFWFELKNE